MPVVDYASMPVELRDGWRATNDWVHGLEFEPSLLRPGDFIPDGNSTHGYVEFRWPAVHYPTTPSSTGYCVEMARSHWIDGVLKFELWYSGSAADTSTIGWSIRAAGRGHGETLMSSDIDVTQAMAGPPAAFDLLISTFTTTLPVTAADRALMVTVSRISPDAYSGVAYLVGVKLTYVPNKL